MFLHSCLRSFFNDFVVEILPRPFLDLKFVFFFSSRSVSYQEIRTADKNIAPNSSTFSKICTSFCFVSFPCVLVRVLLRTFYKYKDNSFPPIDISLYYKFQWRQKKIVYIDNILP